MQTNMENQSNEILKAVTALEERVALLERVVSSMAQPRGATTPAKSAPASQPLSGVAQSPVIKPKTSTEIEIGQKWLSVVGVVLMFLAAFFFVQFVFQYV